MFWFTLSKDSQFLLNPNGISSHSLGMTETQITVAIGKGSLVEVEHEA